MAMPDNGFGWSERDQPATSMNLSWLKAVLRAHDRLFWRTSLHDGKQFPSRQLLDFLPSALQRSQKDRRIAFGSGKSKTVLRYCRRGLQDCLSLEDIAARASHCSSANRSKGHPNDSSLRAILTSCLYKLSSQAVPIDKLDQARALVY